MENSKQDIKENARVKQQQRWYVSRDLSERNGEFAHWKKHDPNSTCKDGKGGYSNGTRGMGRAKKHNKIQDMRVQQYKTSVRAFELNVEGVREKRGLRTEKEQLFIWGKRNYF